MSEEEAVIIQLMLESQISILPPPTRCKEYQSWTDWVINMKKVIVKLPLSSAAQKYTPTANAGASNNTPQGSQAVGSRQNAPVQPPGSQQTGPLVISQPVTQIPSASRQDELWIIFGVKRPRRASKITHITLNDRTDDGLFYRDLKWQYRKH